MINETLVNFSRIQFAITALYHFIFVPLTLGLVMLLGIMETIYVITGREVWKDMTKFWGKLFAINFAMGIATGITMEFQFGTNWAYYSHYVGDIFGVPLAIEGIVAFFLESTFVGIFFFGWDKIKKTSHLLCTWLMAIGTNLSALWILIANGWMQNPVGAKFNVISMRMELSSIWEIITNPVAQDKFVHTISAGYVTGAIFMVAISSYYILKNRDLEIAKKSLIIASAFGLLSSLSLVVAGDESGYTDGQHQKMKLASIEAVWETEEAPASFTLFGWPDKTNRKTHFAVKVPYVLGLIATRSLDTKVTGINDLIKEAQSEITEGVTEYKQLKIIRSELKEMQKNNNNFNLKDFENKYKDYSFNNLGSALLLKKIRPDIENATTEDINKASLLIIPNVALIFWSFRIMVACGFWMILLMILCFYYFSIKADFTKKWLLILACLTLPMPWIASELGWIVAECGRQPWVINKILPTFAGVSSIPTSSVIGSTIFFVVMYTAMLIVDVFLMIKYIKLGPQYLK